MEQFEEKVHLGQLGRRRDAALLQQSEHLLGLECQLAFLWRLCSLGDHLLEPLVVFLVHCLRFVVPCEGTKKAAKQKKKRTIHVW